MTPVREHYRHTSAYEACPACNGHGHFFDYLKSEPDWCRECNGNGYVRARDSRGRFIGRVDPLVNEVVGNLLVKELESELTAGLGQGADSPD